MPSRLEQVVSRTGTHWLREGFFWNVIEPSPGKFSFAHYDHFMLLAAEMHEHVMVLLYQAPRWASPSPNTLPVNPSSYAGYVAAVARRYGPGGTFWRSHPKLKAYAITTFDFWNEPYYDIGNNGHYSPAAYAHLVKAAYIAGHKASPAAKFLIGAEMQGEMVGHNWVWWVNALYQAVPNLNKYFDGVSVHPYGHDISGLAPAITNEPYYGYDQMRRIELIRGQFVRHGAANKPFWVTEVGWPTCTVNYVRCVDPTGQADSLEALLRDTTTRWKSYVRAVFVYYFNDTPGGASNPENDYGLVYANGTAKPVLGVFRAAAEQSPLTAWP